MITHGSRGDVQPFAALAKALTEVGNDVTLAAPAATVAVAAPFCERLVRLHDGPNVLVVDREVAEGFETKFRGLRRKGHLLRTMRKTRELVRAYLNDVAFMAKTLKAEGEAYDVVVHHVTTPGHDVADFFGLPSVIMCPQPYWVATNAFPDPSVPFRIPRQLNRASYVASPAILWAFAGSHKRWCQEELGFQSRRGGKFRQADGRPTTVLYPFSRWVLPSSVSYPPWVHTTGFWFLEAQDSWKPPAALEQFLEDGPPPVYVGFASSIISRPRHLGLLVGEAVRRAQVRAVVVGGWSGVTADDLGDDVMLVNDVPFDWLFRRVAAVVHHGGLGTTGTALATDRPQVVCPAMPDQWFSARSMYRLGVAPAPVPQRQLTVAGLARAIRAAVSDDRMAARAHELGRHVRAEGGVAAAVGVIESVVHEFRNNGDVRHGPRPVSPGLRSAGNVGERS